jgi:hypothetical protein
MLHPAWFDSRKEYLTMNLGKWLVMLSGTVCSSLGLSFNSILCLLTENCRLSTLFRSAS